jgi:hypothetical protein
MARAREKAGCRNVGHGQWLVSRAAGAWCVPIADIALHISLAMHTTLAAVRAWSAVLTLSAVGNAAVRIIAIFE